jgi:hypothetical protein
MAATGLLNTRPAPKRETLTFGDIALPMSAELAAALEFEIDCRSAPLELQPHELADPLVCASLGHHQRRGIAKAVLRELDRRLRDSDFKPTWLNREIHWSLDILAKLRGPGKRALRRAGCIRQFGLQPLTVLIRAAGLDPLSFAALLRFSVPNGPSSRATTVVVTRDDCSRCKQTEQSSPAKTEITAPPCTIKLLPEIEISTHDPRFGRQLQRVIEARTRLLDEMITPMLASTAASAEFDDGGTGMRELTRALQAASVMAVEDEIRALAAAGAANTREAERTTDMVCMRYGVTTKPHSLAKVATAFGCTKQSVQVLIQRCIPAADVLAYAPALRRLVECAQRHSGRPLIVVERELRSQLGATQSLAGAVDFAKDFLGLSLGHATDTRTTPAELAVLKEDNKGNAAAIAKEINRSIRLTGFAVASSVCHAVAQAKEVFVPQRHYEDLVEAMPSLLWVQRDLGVATSATATNPIRALLLRCLLVGEPHGVAEHELVDAIRRAVLRRTTLPSPVTDAHIALGVRVLAPQLHITNEQDGYRLSQLPPETARFTALERCLQERMRAAGGYISAAEALKALEMTRLDQAAAFLMTTDFVVPMLPAGYRLIGNPIASSTLQDVALGHGAPVTLQGRLVTLDVAQSGQTKVAPHARVIYMPVALAPAVTGVFLHHLARWSAVEARANRLRGLSALVAALGVRPQQKFRITFDLKARRLDRVGVTRLNQSRADGIRDQLNLAYARPFGGG